MHLFPVPSNTPLDELDDDALSDGGEEEMTAEQQRMFDSAESPILYVPLTNKLVQMNDAFERIRDTLGEEGLSEIPDNEIKDAIWYYHFDIEQSLDWCLREYIYVSFSSFATTFFTDEQEKRRAAKLRQGKQAVLYRVHSYLRILLLPSLPIRWSPTPGRCMPFDSSVYFCRPCARVCSPSLYFRGFRTDFTGFPL